jgi:DNA-binding transcriptional LysR family regulator
VLHTYAVALCAAILYYLSMPDKKRTSRLDWEDVRYFIALARHGTLSATARALRVNHATVARRITSLEILLARALFERRADGYALTAEGKAVLDEAGAMDEAALSVLRRLDAGTELSGLVRLTSGRTLAETFLIDRLSAFHQRYPAIDIEWIGEARLMSLARREADIRKRLPERDVWLLIRRNLTKVPRVRAVADYLIEVFQRERRLLAG